MITHGIQTNSSRSRRYDGENGIHGSIHSVRSIAHRNANAASTIVTTPSIKNRPRARRSIPVASHQPPSRANPIPHQGVASYVEPTTPITAPAMPRRAPKNERDDGGES